MGVSKVPCNALIADTAIYDIYKYETSITVSRKKSYCDFSGCIKAPAVSYIGDAKNIFLDFELDSISLLEHCCIHNEYCKISSNEKIVRLHNITLRNDLREDRILKRIDHRQKRIYKQHGFKRIVLTATNSGLLVWHRLGFEYDNILDEKKVMHELPRYLSTVKGITGIAYKTLREVPKELFLGGENQQYFTDWLMAHNINNLPMTYRISQ